MKTNENTGDVRIFKLNHWSTSSSIGTNLTNMTKF